MTALDGSKPFNAPVTASKADLSQEGLVMMKNSGANTLELTASVTDTAVAILDQAFKNEEGTQKTTATGDKVGVFFLGTGARVNVASLASQTWTIGANVYLAQTASADGMVETSSGGTPKIVGHYAGDGETTTATDGDLIPVILDMPPGATAV